MSPHSIHVMVVGPTTRCDVLKVEKSSNRWSELVQGMLSGLVLPDELRDRQFAAYCNDDAIRLQLRPNHFARQLGHWRLQGPVVFFRDEGDGEEYGLSPSDVQFLARYLASPPSAEALERANADKAFWLANPSGHRVMSFESMDDLFKALGWEE